MEWLRNREERGFTLIELLVVIAIIGILAAIAIPQFASYRRRGYDSDAKANVRNAATAQEAYFTDKNTYATAASQLTSFGFKQSSNINITIGATVSEFTVTGSAAAGCAASSGIWTFRSTTGALTGAACN